VILGIGVVAALVVARWIHSEQERGLNRFLVVLGSLVAFSAGVNQVGLVVGLLVSLLADVDVPLFTVPAGGGLGILVGFWIGAPRMIMTLSQDYASLGPRRSTSALLPTFLFAQVAVALGTPISFDQAVVTAILGSGAAVGGGAGVGADKLARTVSAWGGSFVLAFALGSGS
jgi:PiT family inorganic phosphate transporter